MDLTRVLDEIQRILRAHGAKFAFLHGSQAAGSATDASDVDVAAYFGSGVDPSIVVADLPDRADLLVLHTAPLELAGRVALHGRLLFEVDPSARVQWQATTRKLYLDEQPRIRQARRDFVEAHARG